MANARLGVFLLGRSCFRHQRKAPPCPTQVEAAVANVTDQSAPTQHAEWRTIEAEAARVHLHPATLRRAIREGELKHIRVRGNTHIRLLPEWTDQWLFAGSPPPRHGR